MHVDRHLRKGERLALGSDKRVDTLRPRLFCGTKTVPVASRGMMAPASLNSNHNNVAMISLQETAPLEIQQQLLLLEAPSL